MREPAGGESSPDRPRWQDDQPQEQKDQGRDSDGKLKVPDDVRESVRRRFKWGRRTRGGGETTGDEEAEETPRMEPPKDWHATNDGANRTRTERHGRNYDPSKDSAAEEPARPEPKPKETTGRPEAEEAASGSEAPPKVTRNRFGVIIDTASVGTAKFSKQERQRMEEELRREGYEGETSVNLDEAEARKAQMAKDLETERVQRDLRELRAQQEMERATQLANEARTAEAAKAGSSDAAASTSDAAPAAAATEDQLASSAAQSVSATSASPDDTTGTTAAATASSEANHPLSGAAESYDSTAEANYAAETSTGQPREGRVIEQGPGGEWTDVGQSPADRLADRLEQRLLGDEGPGTIYDDNALGLPASGNPASPDAYSGGEVGDATGMPGESEGGAEGNAAPPATAQQLAHDAATASKQATAAGASAAEATTAAATAAATSTAAVPTTSQPTSSATTPSPAAARSPQRATPVQSGPSHGTTKPSQRRPTSQPGPAARTGGPRASGQRRATTHRRGPRTEAEINAARAREHSTALFGGPRRLRKEYEKADFTLSGEKPSSSLGVTKRIVLAVGAALLSPVMAAKNATIGTPFKVRKGVYGFPVRWANNYAVRYVKASGGPFVKEQDLVARATRRISRQRFRNGKIVS